MLQESEEGICPYPALQDRLWGDLGLHEMKFEKSAEVIVATRNEPYELWRSHRSSESLSRI